MLLVRRLEPSLLFLLVFDVPFSFLPVGLMAETTQLTTFLGAVALCYNVFVWSMLYLDFALSHHVYLQHLGN
jgi:hypothetical protein